MGLLWVSGLRAAYCAGFDSLLRALLGVTGVSVSRAQVLETVIIASDDVVDGVGARLTTQMADVAVGGEHQRPDDGVPALGQALDPS